jgi:hypothetical protein
MQQRDNAKHRRLVIMTRVTTAAAFILVIGISPLVDAASVRGDTTPAEGKAVTMAGATANTSKTSATTGKESASTASNSQTSASPRTDEQIKWQVVSGGGGRSSSASTVLNATVGQSAAGPSSSTNYRLNAGFWQVFSSGGGSCCLTNSADGRTGNVDADPGKGVDISDLSSLIDFLYISFTPPQCLNSANIDGDTSGGVDISDLTALIDFLYISFALPAPCQ